MRNLIFIFSLFALSTAYANQYVWEYSPHQDQYVCLEKKLDGSLVQEVEIDSCIEHLGITYKRVFDRHLHERICAMTTPNGGKIGEVDDLNCEFYGPELLSKRRSTRLSEKLSQAAAQYPVLIYINKAASGPLAQQILVKHGGRVIFHDKISTGREQVENPPSGRQYFSGTPAGFFTPTRLVLNHYSELWKGYMPFSIFFIGGVAIHKVPSSGIDNLGTRASGGCVRVRENVASQLYEIVEREGRGSVPLIYRDGKVSYSRKNRYRTLVVVEDSSSPVPPDFNILFPNYRPTVPLN